MYKSIKWIIALVCVCAAQLSFAQGTKRLETHLNNGMQSLINDNYDQYAALYPTFHQYIALMENLGLGTEYFEEEYSNPITRIQYQDERMKELDREVARSYKNIKATSSQRSWRSMEFIDYMVNYKHINNINKEIKSVNGLILAYDYSQQAYVLYRFKNVIHFMDKFYGLELDKVETEFTMYGKDFEAIANDYFTGKLEL